MEQFTNIQGFAVAVTGVSLDKASLNFTRAASDILETLDTTAVPSSADNKVVTWSISNDTGFISLSATTSTTITVTHLKASSAVVKAAAQDGSGISGSCTVTVKQLVTDTSSSAAHPQRFRSPARRAKPPQGHTYRNNSAFRRQYQNGNME